ncbi:MAG: type II toxin-antitoxin system RelE/ParE family toxin [Phycisphaeraceae bacterium]|nr:type II toxin-antitoxin system RelE/ParE family toxin [Phycisphaeraceae bacterium]
MQRFRLKITSRAQRDLLQIRDFIAAEAPETALEYYDAFLDRIRELGVFPRRYPIETGIGHRGKEIRSRPIGNYRIIYSVGKGSVHILTVLHGARDRRSGERS